MAYTYTHYTKVLEDFENENLPKGSMADYSTFIGWNVVVAKTTTNNFDDELIISNDNNIEGNYALEINLLSDVNATSVDQSAEYILLTKENFTFSQGMKLSIPIVKVQSNYHFYIMVGQDLDNCYSFRVSFNGEDLVQTVNEICIYESGIKTILNSGDVQTNYSVQDNQQLFIEWGYDGTLTSSFLDGLTNDTKSTIDNTYTSGNLMIKSTFNIGKEMFNHQYVIDYLTYEDPSAPPVLNYPVVTISDTSRNKISDESGSDTSEITFSFNVDVQAWEVRVMGSGNGTGTLADSGGSVTAGQDINAIIDWTELYQEGDNKVNIYGQDLNGNWTPYES